MSNKWIKYILLFCVAGLLAYKSVYFKKLDALKSPVETNDKPADYAQFIWKKIFMSYMDSAVEVNDFVEQLKDNPTSTFEKYSHSQGIGNASYLLVKGEGIVSSINENEIVLVIKSSDLKIKLNTGIYFGNAIRDVTGEIKMSDFNNSIDYNNASTELNKIVNKQVILPLKKNVTKGATVQFVGCTEMSKENLDFYNIDILPVKITIK
jgi:predicted lipoprotein